MVGRNFIDMNTKDFLRLGVPLGQATRLAADWSADFSPLQRTQL